MFLIKYYSKNDGKIQLVTIEKLLISGNRWTKDRDER
jgi:hypothetical protein